MKESYDFWFNSVPAGWDLGRFRRVIKAIRNGTAMTQVDENEEALPVSRIETISSGFIDYNKIGFVEPFNGSHDFLLSEGDLLLSHINSLSMIGNCAIYLGESKLYSGMNLLRIIPEKSIHAKWLLYLIKNEGFKQSLRSWAKPAINQASLTTDKLRDMPILLPPLPIQKAIAAFLDKETARIDALIAKKERQIELLQEKRQAIITRAITKGLDPKAKMKDSGVEWIEEIPEGWEVRRLKFVLSVPLEYGANESAEEDDPAYPRYIRITDFDDSGNLRDETFKSLPIEIARDFLLSYGDILFARSGATVGKTFQYRGETGKACFAGYLIRAKIKPNIISSDYLYYFTKCSTYENWKNSIFIKATIQNIGADKYANLLIPIPPISVQLDITSFLKRSIEESIALQEKLSSSINLLREYRSSLITAAVSGQIDVSQEVAR